MPQVSKKRLDKDVERGIFQQFWGSIAKVNDPVDAFEFFSDLLTSTEQIMLAKRFTIAILLVRGKTASEIKDSIHVTYSTIGTVAGWLKNAKPKTKKILLSLSTEKNWEAIIDKIESFLDYIPPMPGRDWGEAYKGKFKRRGERFARSELR